MRTLLAALGVFLVVAAMGATAAPGAAAGSAGPDGAETTVTTTADPVTATANSTPDSQAADRAQNASLGSEISSFMSSTAASTENSVDRGMWHARVNRSPSHAAVTERVSTLAGRYERLRTEIEQLRAARANGSISEIEFRARRASLRAELHSLGSSVASLSPVATRSGVADSRLAELRDRIPPAAERGTETQPLPPLDPSTDSRGADRVTQTPGRTPETPGAGSGRPGADGLPSPPGQNGTPGAPVTPPGQGNVSVGPPNDSARASGSASPVNASGQGNGPADLPNASAQGNETAELPDGNLSSPPGWVNFSARGPDRSPGESNATSPPIARGESANLRDSAFDAS